MIFHLTSFPLNMDFYLEVKNDICSFNLCDDLDLEDHSNAIGLAYKIQTTKKQ